MGVKPFPDFTHRKEVALEIKCKNNNVELERGWAGSVPSQRTRRPRVPSPALHKTHMAVQARNPSPGEGECRRVRCVTSFLVTWGVQGQPGILEALSQKGKINLSLSPCSMLHTGMLQALNKGQGLAVFKVGA